jgi:hypothetical protein
MKRLLLLTAMLAVPAAAQAEWIHIASSEARAFARYIESTSLVKTKDGISYWSLMDYTKPQSGNAKNYLSTKLQQEMDCKGKRVRLLSASSYAKNRAQGEVVFAMPAKTGDWNPVAVNTITEDVMKYVCKQKLPN